MRTVNLPRLLRRASNRQAVSALVDAVPDVALRSVDGALLLES